VNLFVIVLALTVLLAISSIFLLIKRRKYGKKPLISTSVAFLIALMIVIPLGNQPVVDEMTDAEADEWYEENAAPDPAKEVVSEPEQEELIEEPIITKSESDKIHEGMTYDEVVAIIGEDGVLEKESRHTDFVHTAYKWENTDGSYAFIQFIDKNNGVPLVSDFMFTDLK